MLYRCLKVIVRLAIWLFCRKIIINKPALLKAKGPLLLACNHPNSFLDSVILDTLFEQPIWSLARGDVFKSKMIIRIFTAMKILPVYRTSEGAENLEKNYATFDACVGIFKAKGLVVIFSEGKCINEWHLRPLKKGTARLAIKCWEENIPLTVLPVGINYSSFRRFGKNVYINFGNAFDATVIRDKISDGAKHSSFNQKLNDEFKQLVYEIPKENTLLQKKKLQAVVPFYKKILLSVPALAGFLLHWPLYIPLKRFTIKNTWHNDHHDSILMALLLFSYPVYLLLISLGIFIWTKNYTSFFLLLLLPLCAWSYMQIKPQLDKTT